MIYAEITPISKTQNLLSQYNYTIFYFSEKPWKKDSNEFSFAFTGNAFAFQTLDGKPITVTYTIDAEVKSLTPQ